MQFQVYVPQTVEIPDEYLPALAQRAYARLAETSGDAPATRGNLVRQAIRDGLVRELFHLLKDDGSIEVFCDPGAEIPLRLENRTLKVSDLIDVLQKKFAETSDAPSREWVEHARAKSKTMQHRNAA